MRTFVLRLAESDPLPDPRRSETRMIKDEDPGPGDAATTWSFLTDADLAARRLNLSFGGIQAIHAFHNELVTGDPNLHFLEHFRRRHLSGVPRPLCASLGSGDGNLERCLLGMNWRFESLEGLELNETLVRHATERIASMEGGDRVHYRMADLNRIELAPVSLDLAIFFHSLHHVTAVEACLSAVAAALRPGGRLLVVDYFGGNRLQRPRAILDRCDALLCLIPERLRVDLARSTRTQLVVKTRCSNLPVSHVIAADPSEAIRSEDLRRVLDSTAGLRVIEEKPLAGTLLDPLFQDIAGNFLPADPIAAQVVHIAIACERMQLAEGAVPPDYRYIVATRT
jgi:SAM-dependent methyltransferase